MHSTIARGLLFVGLLLASAACQQNGIGMPEIVRIAERRLSSETVSYRCNGIDYERHRLSGELGKRIEATRKKGDHALYCQPSRGIAFDGEKIVFVSKYGVFQY
jgi:hypothetical protein